MLGVVLCGGASLRMGRDKGLLSSVDGSWAQVMLEKLQTLGMTAALSVNKNQFEQYTTAFPQIELIVDNDALPVKGPLAAVLSIHVKYPGEDLLVTACDMPLMDPDVLRELYDNYLMFRGKDGFVFTNDGEPEPLCAIYSAKGLSSIKDLLQAGQLTRHSMKFMLGHLEIARMPIPENRKPCFRNFNAHADLNGL
jgi:molybdenum cofactor guanylyltransferase